jgi:hypothetical protein
MDYPDYSTIFAINKQQRRLGWTTEQLRGYLVATYGKRATSILTEAEQRDLLNYMETLEPLPF